MHDGVEALDYLFGRDAGGNAKPLPQLVLLDLKLPKIDGLEVLRRIRTDARTRLLPVVILTTSTEDKDRTDGYRLGANSYVRKPVDFIQFAEAVGQLGLYWLVLNEPPPTGTVRGADMGEKLRVLIVEDNERDAALLVRELKRGGYDLT